MGSPIRLKHTLKAILSSAYTPYDLREFVQACYDLALPLIRKKIIQGKINLEMIGLKEPDVVYDCIADLFQRDQESGFPEIRTFFSNHIQDFDTSSEEELLVTLRRLIFGKVNNNIIRLYSEVDPTLAKILRNIKLAVERTKLFEERVRFGETFLAPCSVDHLLDRTPLPFEWIEREFSNVVMVHDNTPTMLKKLHGVIVEQDEFQRMIPFVTTGLLFKQVHKLGWETEQAVGEAVEIWESIPSGEDKNDLSHIIDKVCVKIRTEMYLTYVGGGKRTEQVFDHYMAAVKTILLNEFGGTRDESVSYYESLQSVMPGLLKDEYARQHRTVLEYLAKIAKERMREELKKL